MNKFLISAVIPSLFLANVALANGGEVMPPLPPPMPQLAHSGWVVGIDAGYGHLSTPERDLREGVNWIKEEKLHHDVTRFYGEGFDESHSIGGLVGGAHVGYDAAVKPYMTLGWELGYRYLGKSTYDTDHVAFAGLRHHEKKHDEVLLAFAAEDWHRKVDQQAVSALLTGHYYLMEGLNIFVKGGVAFVGAKTTNDYTYVEGVSTWKEENGKREKEHHAHHKHDEHTKILYALKNDYTNTTWRLRPEAAAGISYTFAVQQNQFVDVYAMYDYIFGSYNGADVNAPANVYGAHGALLGVSYKF